MHSVYVLYRERGQSELEPVLRQCLLPTRVACAMCSCRRPLDAVFFHKTRCMSRSRSSTRARRQVFAPGSRESCPQLGRHTLSDRTYGPQDPKRPHADILRGEVEKNSAKIALLGELPADPEDELRVRGPHGPTRPGDPTMQDYVFLSHSLRCPFCPG